MTTIGMAAVKAGKSGYRCSLADLIEALSKAEREGRLIEQIRFYTRVSLLIILSCDLQANRCRATGEIGYLPITTGGANLFFRLVNTRCEKAR